MADWGPLSYPDVHRDESVVDDYHGVLIADPYRWLEGSGMDVKDFVTQQMKVTESVLDKCETRAKLKQKMTELYDFPKYTCPFKKNNKYFYYHNTGLQAFNVLYVQESLDAESEVVFDPHVLSEDGSVALSSASFSENTEFVALACHSNGSDWATLKIYNVPQKKMEPEELCWTKFSTPLWTHDNKGFFYGRYPAPEDDTATSNNVCHQLYYHFLGTDQSEDILCWQDTDNPIRIFEACLTEDGKYLVLRIIPGSNPINMLAYCNLETLPGGLKNQKGLLPFTKIVDTLEAKYKFITNDDGIFTILTNKDAPKYKLVRVDIKNPKVWREVIPETEDVLDQVTCVNKQQLLVLYLKDVKHVLQLRDLETGSLIKHIPLDIGTVTVINGTRKDSEIFFEFENPVTPGIMYRCDLSKDPLEVKVFRETVIKGFDSSQYETKQVFFPSKDGTRLTMFINARKSLKLDGSHPVMLYGYGGFNISSPPEFYFSRIVLLKHCDTIWATAVIRGGGEYGNEWHRAGSFGNKQKSLDDFKACAEYLINEGYTQPSKLGIEGASNGGLLVAACINQFPELLACGLSTMGATDMLRYHMFTIASAWKPEYGCSEIEEEFRFLIKYSPLHNVRRAWEESSSPVQYPATLFFTSDHDNRVVPSHIYKMIATMQYILVKTSPEKLQTNPIVARIEANVGHAMFARPTHSLINEATDKFAFFAKATGAPWMD